MADSKDPNEPEGSQPPPRPYWAQPSEPIGPPMEQIPAEVPPHGQQAYGQPQQWGPAQPQYGNWGGEKPPSYLAWAIAATALFCLPLGVVSIFYATRVNQRWRAGDVAGAQGASERAKKFAIASVIIGAIALALIFATGSWDS